MKSIRLSREVYDIPTPREIAIGDPKKFEKIAYGTASHLDRRQVFANRRIPKSWKAAIAFTKELWDGRYATCTAHIYASHTDYISFLQEEKFFLDTLRTSGDNDLVCDESESYEISVSFLDADEHGDDHYYQLLRMGQSGIFGHAFDFYRQYGFAVSFEFPCGGKMTEPQMRQCLAKLFRCPEIASGIETGD